MDEQVYEKYVTYVFRNSDGSLTRVTQPLRGEDDPEANYAPNTKFYVAMFEGKSVDESINKAQAYINDLHNRKTEQAKKGDFSHTVVKGNGSYVKFPDGTQIRLVDEADAKIVTTPLPKNPSK